MSYTQAIEKAARLARAKRQTIYVVLADALWGEYDTATESQLDWYYLGAEPLVAFGAEGEALT